MMKKPSWLSFLWKDVSPRVRAESLPYSDFLRKTSFFKEASDWEIKLIQEHLHTRQYQQGETVFELGHPGAALYFVYRGKVVIEIPHSNNKDVDKLAELTEGQFFGELALLDGSPRTASAIAQEECVILVLPRTELDRMIQENPKLALAVYRSLAKVTGSRLVSTLERLQSESADLRLVVNG